MNYKKMIETAKQSGAYTDKTMWQSVSSMSDLLEKLKETDEKMYWRFIRRQHGILYANHYSEDFALHDVANMQHTCKDGRKHSGAHWTSEEIEEAVKGMTFPSGVNRWDRYVAFNAAASDFCKHFDDKQILQIAYDFYFADEDFPGNDKVWCYMCMTYGC